jgi:hypothetical protein
VGKLFAFLNASFCPDPVVKHAGTGFVRLWKLISRLGRGRISISAFGSGSFLHPRVLNGYRAGRINVQSSISHCLFKDGGSLPRKKSVGLDVVSVPKEDQGLVMLARRRSLRPS